jgi:peptidyl-prolyl cis-trans isomerase C
MRKQTILMFLAVMMVLAFGCNKAQDGDKPTAEGDSTVLAEIAGEKITVADFREELEGLPPYLRNRYKTSRAKEKLLEQMVTRRLLYKQALKEKVDQDPEFKRELENDRVKRITRRLLDKHVPRKQEVTEEDMQKYYDEHPDEFSTPEQIRARHILVKVSANAPEEEVAEARSKIEGILRQVRDGGDFAQVARETSEGPTRSKGGDLGFFPRGRMDKAFEEAAFVLEVGQVSDVVRSRFGFHVIKLEEKKEPQEKKYDEVKAQIKRKLRPMKQQETYQAFIDGLKTQFQVTMHNDRLSDGLPDMPTEPGAKIKKKVRGEKKKGQGPGAKAKQVNEADTE